MTPDDRPRVFTLRPPYVQLTPISGEIERLRWGEALIWDVDPRQAVDEEAERLLARPHGIPLFIVLPDPGEIMTLELLSRRIWDLDPSGILPSLGELRPLLFKRLLTVAPSDPALAVFDYLDRRGVLTDERARKAVFGILKASGEVRTVAQLARALAVSRRTLGRHFSVAGLPAPSHWLQFGRLFRASVLLQRERLSVSRAATSLGYPDGFTLSNQMKRLIGHRPMQVKALLGWRWVVEAWLTMERMNIGSRFNNIRRLPMPPIGKTSS
jgi:AraC-like DNA-binding protein